MSAIDKTSFFQIIECLNETNKEDLIQTLLNVAAQAMAFDLLKNNLSDSNMQKTVALSSDSVLTNKTVISENDKKVRNAKKGVDRGYTDFSEEYQLKEAEKVKYDI